VKGAALLVIGVWVVLQTTKGPLAEKIGLVKGVADASSTSAPQPGSIVDPPGGGTPTVVPLPNLGGIR
jgi:hypothetical protein